jgi:8-oxo-dGDP phosphatase
MSAVADPAPEGWEVASSELLLGKWLLTVRADDVRSPRGNRLMRIAVGHPGAVAVLALDASDQVLMIRQYRHPVGRELWEVPAGLRDAAGEPLLAAAQRELWEETRYRAGRWHTLVDYYTSPGFSDERIRIFLARDLEPPSAEELARLQAQRADDDDDEESYIATGLVPLAEAVGLALAGKLRNGPAIAAILAGSAALARGFDGLRPAGVPDE